jgi:hypothetical protein
MPDTMSTPPIDTNALDRAVRRFPNLLRMMAVPDRDFDREWKDLPRRDKRLFDRGWPDQIRLEYHRILRERAP